MILAGALDLPLTERGLLGFEVGAAARDQEEGHEDSEPKQGAQGLLFHGDLVCGAGEYEVPR
jgi:hypothetical protein